MGCQTNKHHCSGPTFWVILGVQEESIVGNKSWHEAYTNLEMAWKTVENGEVFAFFFCLNQIVPLTSIAKLAYCARFYWQAST